MLQSYIVSLGLFLVPGLIGLVCFPRVERRAPIEASFPDVPWGWPEALLAILLPFFFLFLFAAVDGRELAERSVLASVGMQAAAGVLTVAGLVGLLWRIPGFRPGHLGLRWRGAAWIALLGITGYLAFLPLYKIAELVNAGVHKLFGRNMEMQTSVLGVAQEQDPLALAGIFLAVTIVVPISEEICFRAVVFGALRKYLGRRTGIVVSAIVFSLFHLGSPLIPILTLGMLLAWLYDRSRSLVAPVAVHMLHNALVLTIVRLFPSVVEGAGGG